MDGSSAAATSVHSGKDQSASSHAGKGTMSVKNKSQFSMASQSTRKTLNRGAQQREDQISRSIAQVIKDRDHKMTQSIIQTIYDDKLKVYKMYRKEFETKINELEKERGKIQRRKKNKKEKQRALRNNTVEKMSYICMVIKKTFQHYKQQYFESDNYRLVKMMEISIENKEKKIKENQQEIQEIEHEKIKLEKLRLLGQIKMLELEMKQEKPQKGMSKKETQEDALKRQDSTQQIEEKKEKLQEQIEELEKKHGPITVSSNIDPTSFEEKESELEERLQEAQEFDPKTLNPYSSKKFIAQIIRFFDSPFKDDKKFAVFYMSLLTRDKIDRCEDVMDYLFYDRIFKLLTETKDAINRHYSFEILCNMTYSKEQRHKLAEEDYLKDIFDKMTQVADSGSASDNRILEQLSWLVTLVSFHQDMFDYIIKLDLLKFIIKISDSKFPSSIRSNAVLAISLLTYNENLFDEIIDKGVIELIMALCRDPNQDLTVKQFSTLALVHFALNKKSINILIDKGVLELFDTFGQDNAEDINVVIQTNVSWIFLALCNNGITGSTMLRQGITRDMFLVSCNPEYQQIRHLVITGFAELGRSREKPKDHEALPEDKQRLKETAIVKMHNTLEEEAQVNIDILLKFTASDDMKFQHTAFWALKNYILLTDKDQYIKDISLVIRGIINGCLSKDHSIQAECASSLSFLVTHSLVYQSEITPKMKEPEIAELIKTTLKSEPRFILDAVMYFSGCESTLIRTTAFSILSSLSKFSSQCRSVMSQIKRDIFLPAPHHSKEYLQFIEKRLIQQQKIFYQKVKQEDIESQYSGLYSLLRLALEPTEEEIEDTMNKYIDFISIPYDPEDEAHVRNESYFIKVFVSLKHSKNPKVLSKLLGVIQFYIDLDESRFQKEVIDPHTILWMLEIMEQHRQEKYLCCLTSSTLLRIVSKHEIHFYYQEVAIIKKFNAALQNIDVFGSEKRDGSQDPESSSELDSSEMKRQTTQEDKTPQEQDRASQINLQESIEPPHQDHELGDQFKDNHISKSQLDLNGDQLQLDINATSQSRDLALNLQEMDSESVSGAIKTKLSTIPSNQDESGVIQLQKVSQEGSDQSPKMMKTAKSGTLQSEHEDEQRQHTHTAELKSINELDLVKAQSHQIDLLNLKQKSSSIPKTNKTLRELKKMSSRKRSSSFFNLAGNMRQMSGILNGIDNSSKKESDKTSIRRVTIFNKSKANRITKKYFRQQASQKIDPNEPECSEDYETIEVEKIDPEDIELVEIHMRDSLIKSFMVIFTNEKSQHLLLNKDLIDIAFNCLEFATDCTLEAKRHVAKLISIIFKFPQVQVRLMAQEVVVGICELLRSVKHLDIIRFTIKACTYISMNYDFIKESQYSLVILEAMMRLLDQMKDRNDQYNVILTIKNILRGDKANKLYFLDHGGTQKFTDIILQSDDLQLIEMCINGIAEQASYKKFMVKILNHPGATQQLKQIIQKTLDITENWHHDINLKDFEHAKQQIKEDLAKGLQGLSGVFMQQKKLIGQHSKPIRAPSKRDLLLPEGEVYDTNFQVPEFMKNDLKKFTKDGDDINLGFDDSANVTIHGRIRKSAYYVIARGIKFGLDAKYLIEHCFLTQKIIKDLSLQNENQFIFQNLLLVISNLKLESQAIVELLGNNYDNIIDQIYDTKDKDRRISLLKVLINLVLEASQELAPNAALFQKLYEISKDQRSDENMIENVLWMATSLCEQKYSNRNFNLIVQHMMNNQIMLIVWKSLSSKQERIILQALKLTTKLCDEAQFKTKLFNQKEIFEQIKEISISTDTFKKYQIEIQTALCKCLDKITMNTSEDENADYSPGKQHSMNIKQIDQIKIFNKYLINLAIQKNYIITRLDDPPEEEMVKSKDTFIKSADIKDLIHNISRNSPSNKDELSHSAVPPSEIERINTDQGGAFVLNQIDQEMDDIERLQDSNEMVENIVCTLANISFDFALHPELIQNGFIEVIKKFVELFLYTAKVQNDNGVNEQEEGIELSVMPTGTLQLIKAITITIENLSSNPDIHAACINQGIMPLIKECLMLHDYEVQTHIFTAMGSYLTSPDSDIRRKMVHSMFLQEMLRQHEESRYFRIKRICSEYLNHLSQFDNQMFELNDLLLTRMNRENDMNGDLMHEAPGAM